ncbi:hypothetical protein AAG607_12790 [Citromicrobium bathyomarinum]|uniref:hypothetical protein n=1 Tax=Sphingomonadales TaxID=204457 RepID=UPI000C570AF8|nr:hypothetical protein [Citromicrobium sp.]
MKGYVYITGTGADPAEFNNISDPTFGEAPSLGACMSNLREFVDIGDYLFVVSGKAKDLAQYVFGGMRVAEKIDHLAAYGRFPQNRLRMREDGVVVGNIIVDAKGNKHPLDHHADKGFDRRVKNFIVGADPLAIQSPKEVELARQQTLSKLSDIIGKQGNRPIDILGRQRKLNEDQVIEMINWLRGIKQDATK